MAELTGKQIRNGIPEPADGHNSAVANEGPMPAVPMGAAMSAAMSVMSETEAFFASPAGSGVDGHEIGAHGSIFEWDSGLAINDVEGGGSA